jgi:hypothetical protein
MLVQRVVMPGSVVESWTVLGEEGGRWSRSSDTWPT